MPGASDEHELVSGNLFAAFHQKAKGGGCRVYKSDMKLLIKLHHADLFVA